MDENKIHAWGYFLNRVFIGIAAVVGAFQAPQAISNYAVNVKSQQIMNNTMSSIVKMVTNIKNENHNTIINQYKEKLQNSLDNPSELKKQISDAPEPVLRELGLKTSKEDLSISLKNANTTDEARRVLNDKIPDILLDSNGKPFVLDHSRLGQ